MLHNNNECSMRKNSAGRLITKSAITTGGAIGSYYGATKIQNIVIERTDNPILGVFTKVGVFAIGMTITNAITTSLFDSTLTENHNTPNKPIEFDGIAECTFSEIEGVKDE